MPEERLLKKLALMLLTNNKLLLLSIRKDITSSEERVRQELKEEIIKTKQELSEKIASTQEDTIEALSDLVHTGYDLHEERIVRIETQLDLPPLKQKH